MSICNLIPALNNAIKANKIYTYHKASKQNLAFLEVLKENNLIQGYNLSSKTKVKIFFVYTLKKSPILSIKCGSKPSIPVTISQRDLWKFNKSLTSVILRTSKGIITNKTALSKGLGGEVLAIIL